MPYGIEQKKFIIMVHHWQRSGEFKESIAQAEFARAFAFIYFMGGIMINNTALQKWSRLAQKNLDQQFVNTVIKGLQCSPFEAQALLDAVYKVYASYFETSGTLKPGQFLFQVVAINAASNTPLADCEQKTVVLTLDDGQEDLHVKRQQGVVGLRLHRIQRLANEAFQQGGLLTVEDLANRLLNCGERTLCRDIQTLHSQGISLPLRSTIKDMGRAISHRCIIVEHWLRGYEYEQIAQATHHSIPSVQNYICKFKRVVALALQGFDIHSIGFLVKLSSVLVEQYYSLYQNTQAVSHRRKELRSFLKKNSIPMVPERGVHE
ncbi:MAG: DUF1670 domain-containing protein [Thermodesulfovibrionales bacterium]|nr:DUF1670 domain-containing protein [Thermodesulfovibrionales bacterium]